MFDIRPAQLSEILKAHALIPEFTLGGEHYLASRLAGKTALCLISCDGTKIAGYSVCYVEGDAVYIWLAGTTPEYRGNGVFSEIFTVIQQWARVQGAVKLRLKTTNAFRGMLEWVVKSGFVFVRIEPQENSLDNGIIVERALNSIEH